ncbi:MAG: T9SS type A sorting domain-containing protein [candidate division KSB1 bacterium]|nr:T9SS type A sorting domain-containing protein [candidate division KSB1 bacterium]
MRRGLWVALIVMVILGVATGVSAAQKTYGVLAPAKGAEKSEVIYLTPDEWAALRSASPALGKHAATLGIIDTVWTEKTLSGVNFGFASNDTFAAYFKPPAAMIIKSIGFNAHTWSSSPLSDGITVSLRWALGYHADYPPDSVNARGWIGYWQDGQWVHNTFAPQPPLGEMFWGDIPWTVDENAIEEVPTIYMGVEPDVGRRDFFVVIVPYGGPEGAYVGFDAGTATNIAARGLKYYQGPGTSGKRGWHIRSYGWWTYCVVEFYENTPPAISGLTQIVSTYNPNKPFKARCEITDIDASDPTKAGVDKAYLVWKTASKVDSALMVNVEGNIWEGQITGVGVGDEIEYWVGAKDKGGLYAKSGSRRFRIAQPEHPNADLLLCFQNALNPNFFEDVLDNLGYVYEVWDVEENYGIDESVTGFGWKTIFVVGWGASSVPTRAYAGNPFATFLQNGGNLFLSDMDYFYGNGEPATPTFQAGEFAYDFFGIAGGENDPGANLDSVFVGVAGDPISGDFATDPLRMTWWAYANYRGYNWTDYLTPAAATAIFTAESGKTVGVRYQGANFKTVNLAFMADCVGEATPSPQLATLVRNVLNWFGTSPGVGVAEAGEQVPHSYSLSQNYPNPFNPTTTIEYSLAKAGQVRLTVYNVLGQKVATLVDGYKPAGQHRVTFDARNLPSGIYFYKLEAGDYQAIHKMVLNR